jgi:homogentisate 1,2-dioxygenase
MLDRITQGKIPRKHHIAFKDDAGKLLYEECFTREGFSGPYTIMYHQGRPHAMHAQKAEHGWKLPLRVEGKSLAKRHFKSQEAKLPGGAALDARVPLLFNDDVTLAVLAPTEPDPVYFVNGDGDDLYFIQKGSGTLRSILGDLRFEADDYLAVPRGIIHRFIPDSGVEQRWLSIECLGGMHLPRQWRNDVGQLRMDAPFSHRDFKRPVFNGPLEENIRQVVVKKNGAFHGYRWDHNPLDVVGWDGSVYPFVFPILNFQPRAGLVHLPPDWHGTFAARGALVCSFVPRVTDFHPEAVPCPYPHASVDCDEFLFYVRGNFTSRRGVGPGSISFHPAGIMHGPHPGAYEKSIGSSRTDELAVMLDTFKPLQMTAAAMEIEDPGYMESFIA